MTDPTHDDEHREYERDDEDDVSARLHAALRERPAPPPTWDLHAVKTRGRRRRIRTRVLSVTTGVVVLAGLGVNAATSGVSWPWTSTSTTTVAAAVNDHPEQVVRNYLAARQAGDNARAYDDYWVSGTGARINVTSEPLVVDEIDVGTAQPQPSDPVTAGWQQAVTVPVTLRWNTGPDLITGKTPITLKVVLVRNTDQEPWRIVSSEESPTYTVPTVPAPDPVVAVTGYPEDLARDAVAQTGTLGWDQGCLVLEENQALLVWPQGSVWDSVAQQVVLADGHRIGIGDPVETWGSPLDDLPAYLGQDGGAAITACDGVGVPAGGVANGGRPVLEVSTFQS
jgi:hypothetical protein